MISGTIPGLRLSMADGTVRTRGTVHARGLGVLHSTGTAGTIRTLRCITASMTLGSTVDSMILGITVGSMTHGILPSTILGITVSMIHGDHTITADSRQFTITTIMGISARVRTRWLAVHH